MEGREREVEKEERKTNKSRLELQGLLEAQKRKTRLSRIIALRGPCRFPV